MRFNDYHKDVCRCLGLVDEEQRRAIRVTAIRCYAAHHSVNAAVAIVRMEREERARIEALEAAKRGIEA